jgi:hypothetical protein
MKVLRPIALAANTLFILWVLYNGIDDGFRDIGTVQGIVPITLVLLLILNLVLLLRRK